MWTDSNISLGANVTVRFKSPDYGVTPIKHCEIAAHARTHALTHLLISDVRKGDRVSIYLPMIPELVYTMLACARIGAVHSIVVSRIRGRAAPASLQVTFCSAWSEHHLAAFGRDTDADMKSQPAARRDSGHHPRGAAESRLTSSRGQRLASALSFTLLPRSDTGN